MVFELVEIILAVGAVAIERGDSEDLGVFDNCQIGVSAYFPISKNYGIRALYRYEQGTIDDWHYDGVQENPLPAAGQAYLDSGLGDYSTSVVGLFVHVNF